MKKISNFEWKSKTGKSVKASVERIYGTEAVEYNCDGDKTIVNEFVDKFFITVDVDGKSAIINTKPYQYKGIWVVDFICNKLVAIPEDVAKAIIAATEDVLTDEISQDEQNAIDNANAAIDEGKVMPAAEIKEKREGYRKMMGGDCYNPYYDCMSAERVAELRAKHPDKVKTEYVIIYSVTNGAGKDINYAFNAIGDESAVAYCRHKFSGITGKIYEYDSNYKPGRFVCDIIVP